MRVFYLVAIVFVVDGHTTNGHLFEMNGLSRYYSFHLMMFAFGSGYFFKLYGGACSDLAHRAKKLLVPLYLWNAVYGVGAALLRRFGGFELGEPLSAYTLLLAPLADGEHFVWNLGSWFIFPLFCVQMFYALIHRLSRLWYENEVMTFLLCLIPGCVAVQLCYTGRQDALPLWMLRPMILLPGFAGGMLYRRVLERRDHLPTVSYLIGIVILRALLCGMRIWRTCFRIARTLSAMRSVFTRARRWRLRFICAFPACLRRISAKAALRWQSAAIPLI